MPKLPAMRHGLHWNSSNGGSREKEADRAARRPRQPHHRHGPPVGHLPETPNMGIMASARTSFPKESHYEAASRRMNPDSTGDQTIHDAGSSRWNGAREIRRIDTGRAQIAAGEHRDG